MAGSSDERMTSNVNTPFGVWRESTSCGMLAPLAIAAAHCVPNVTRGGRFWEANLHVESQSATFTATRRPKFVGRLGKSGRAAVVERARGLRGGSARRAVGKAR